MKYVTNESVESVSVFEDGYLCSFEHYGNIYNYCKCHSEQGYHNDNGPAITHNTGDLEYWTHGKFIKICYADGIIKWNPYPDYGLSDLIEASSKEEFDRKMKMRGFL